VRACDHKGDRSGPSVDCVGREKLSSGSMRGKETRTVHIDEPLVLVPTLLARPCSGPLACLPWRDEQDILRLGRRRDA
jgi:hypothetical protein